MGTQPLTIERARAAVGRSIRDGEHEIEAGSPYENQLNSRTGRLVEAYRNGHGTAWLGRVNFYQPQDDGKPALWEWDGEPVTCFSACLVLPAFDAELERLIIERRDAPYTGTAEDSRRVGAIFERVEALGGQPLIWN